MKTQSKFCFLTAAFLFLSFSFMSAGNKDTLKYSEAIIEISSRLTIKGSPAKEYQIYLSLDGIIVDSVVVKKSKLVYFELEPEKLYAIVYKKEGFPDKIIMVDTKVPEISKYSIYFNVDFDIELDHESSTQKKDFLDYPVAIIRYDSAEQDFGHSKKYYKEVHHK